MDFTQKKFTEKQIRDMPKNIYEEFAQQSRPNHLTIDVSKVQVDTMDLEDGKTMTQHYVDELLKAESPEQFLGFFAGIASVCWIEENGERIFDSTKANALVNAAMQIWHNAWDHGPHSQNFPHFDVDVQAWQYPARMLVDSGIPEGTAIRAVERMIDCGLIQERNSKLYEQSLKNWRNRMKDQSNG